MRLHLLQAGRSLRGGESWPALARRCEALLQMPLRTESHRSGQAAQQTLQVRPFVLLSSLSGFTALMQNNMRVKWVLFCRSSNCGLFKWERDGMLKVKSLLFRSFKERKQKKNRIIHCCERNRPDVALDVFFFFPSGESRTKDRRRAPPASRRGARQVPQQQVTAPSWVSREVLEVLCI